MRKIPISLPGIALVAYLAIILLTHVSANAEAVHSEKLNASEIEFHVSNHGTIAKDEQADYPDWDGFKFPADSAYPLVYIGGLWLRAIVDGESRVAISGSGTEFAVGPYSHEPVEDSSIFKVYRIAEGGESDSGWINWPSNWGAPTDEYGEPLLTGSQSLWAVFNDNAPVFHTQRGGSTDPLGAEVQVYAYDFVGGDFDNMVFVDFKIINKSEDDWTDFIASVYLDPDIGFYSDDLCGTDSAMSMAYCYSLTDPLAFPPDYYPVVGMAAVRTPTFGTSLPPLIACNAMVNTYYSTSVEMTEDLMMGLQDNGTPFINPETGEETRFPFNGNPINGSGWLDSDKGDRRIMLSTWPFNIASGDTTLFRIAIFAADGETRGDALSRLFDVAGTALDFGTSDTTGLEVIENVEDGSIHSIEFEPVEHLWFSGLDWGGEAFNGGIGWAGDLWGSSLERNNNFNIEIEFSPEGGQDAYRFAENVGGYSFVDIVTVPFECRKKSTGEILNVIFIDGNSSGEWEAVSDSSESHEYILITSSEMSDAQYTEYGTAVLPHDAGNLDLMYVVSLLEREGERIGMREGQVLSIETSTNSPETSVDTLDFGEVVVGSERSLTAHFASGYKYEKSGSFAIDSLDVFHVGSEKITLPPGDRERFNVIFTPPDTGQFCARLMLRLNEFDLIAKELVLVGYGSPWSLKGDINLDGVLELRDITLFIRYLYYYEVNLSAGTDPDLDNSGIVDLTDLVMLINRIFLLEEP